MQVASQREEEEMKRGGTRERSRKTLPRRRATLRTSLGTDCKLPTCSSTERVFYSPSASGPELLPRTRSSDR